MNKDRLAAFMDAVIAIVMTILVLQLREPAEPTIEGFLDIRVSFASYAISFFWLASMWMSLHNAWHTVDKISTKTIWLSIILLFFSSLMPYSTSLVASYFYSSVIQGFYALIVVATTVMMVLIYQRLSKDNSNKPETVKYMKRVSRLILIDIGIMTVGTLLGVLFWSPIASIGIIVAALFIIVVRSGDPEMSNDDKISQD